MLILLLVQIAQDCDQLAQASLCFRMPGTPGPFANDQRPGMGGLVGRTETSQAIEREGRRAELSSGRCQPIIMQHPD